MNAQTIIHTIEVFFAGVRLDEHSLLLVSIGVIIGSFLSRGGGVHRRLYGAYRRYRGRY